MSETAAGLASRERSLPSLREITQFAFVLGQLLLLALVIRQFQIENSAFLRVYILVVLGFSIHYFIPNAYRLAFFSALSVGSIVMILGGVPGLTLILIGLALIGICHIPVSWRARIAILVGAAVLLGLSRNEIINVSVATSVWPILGSMFMFRLVVYVYDFKHEKTPPDFWSSVAYFFMVPNICFPLFPVVDYKSFRRLHMDRPLFETSNLGATWILRGVTHLILYRIVYYYFTLAPHEVVDPNTLTQFLVANFLLYLRISGHFHLIVGMLHLFGFRLPETHHRYILSSSFTEFWRRINIYWKDFMMKVFYFPIFFKLRKYGETNALVIATLLVFIGTWAAHSYQWFWLRGRFPVVWQDIVFWGFLAVLVVVNALWELKRGRKRSLKASSWSLKDKVMLGIKTVVTFYSIVILWSIWTSESLSTWSGMWNFQTVTFPTYFVLVAIVIFVGSIFFGHERKAGDTRSKELFQIVGISATWGQLRSNVALVFLTLLGLPFVYTQLGTQTANFVTSIRSEQLSRVDAAELQRGYYEDLTRVDRFNSQLWEVYAEKPVGWLNVTGSGLTRFTGDFAQTELIPSMRSTTNYGTISTNRWGMRDQEYEKIPANDTFRIAVIGESNAMGWGVKDGETFEALVEKRLLQTNPPGRWTKFESLNFGMPGWQPAQKAFGLERALTFQPSVVMYIANGRELGRAIYHLAETYVDGREIPFEDLAEIVGRANINDGDSQSDAQRKLLPYREEIIEAIYQYIADTSKRSGAHPVFVFLPPMSGTHWVEEAKESITFAQAAGFSVVDLTDVYTGHRDKNLQIEEWDEHPNAFAHGLIAESIYTQFIKIWPQIVESLTNQTSEE